MTRALSGLTLTLSVLALASCGEDGIPTQPGSAGDQPPPAPSFAVASNSWAVKAPVPTTAVPNNEVRRALSAGVANNAAGKPILYIFGGGADQKSWNDIEAYDVATDTWALKGRFPTTDLMNTNGVGKIGNKLYISGGYTGASQFSFAGIQNSLFAYDYSANVAIRKADMPRHTADGVTGVIGTKLYVLAGLCFPDCVDLVVRRLYRYDPATNRWTDLAWCPHPHANGVGGVINGKFYVASGLDGQTGPTATLDVYDPATNKWKTLPPMPDARAHAAGAVVDNRLYVVGGLGKDAYEETGAESDCPRSSSCGRSSVFVYDPATNK